MGLISGTILLSRLGSMLPVEMRVAVIAGQKNVRRWAAFSDSAPNRSPLVAFSASAC